MQASEYKNSKQIQKSGCVGLNKLRAITVFPRIDAAAFIYFVVQFGAATIRGRRLFEGGVYSRAAFITLGSMTVPRTQHP